MINKLNAIPIILTCIFAVIANSSTAIAVSFQEYDKALEGSQKIQIEGISRGDGKELDAYTNPKVKGLTRQ